MSRLRIALEGVINGKAARELEYTFYGKVANFEQLQEAVEVEEHEQWTLPLDTEQPIRTRLRLINNRRPTITTKLKRPGVLGFEEVNSDISNDLYQHLKIAAIDGYKKTRYNFPVHGTPLKWEIDVFLDRSGNPHPWVKIDFEVNDPKDRIPDLPIDITEIIIDGGPKQTLEEKRFVRLLWESEWQRIDAVAGGPVVDKEED